MSAERTVLWAGNPAALSGNEVTVGQKAPDATLVNNQLQSARISDFGGKVLILSALPSLDTSICDTETRRFNEIAASLGDDVAVVTISMDLPFTQKRWCGAAGIENVVTLSDSKDREFGKQYGVFIEKVGVLARCIFVVDREGIVRNIQLVPNVGQEPDYDQVVEAVKALI